MMGGYTMKPGEYILKDEDIICNEGRDNEIDICHQ